MKLFTVNRHVTALMENEWAQLRRNKVVIFTTLGPPLLLVALSLMVLFLITFLDVEKEGASRLSGALPSVAQSAINLGKADTMLSALLTPFLLMFQMIPLVVPITIASYSIIGEKQSRSLEALLATPVRTWELLLGKSLASALPGVLATWYTYLTFAFAARFVVSDAVFTGVIASHTWILAVVLLTPLFALLAVQLAVIISSRVRDPQSAQQLGSLVVLPLVGLLVAQVTGAVTFGLGSIITAVIVIGLLDLVLMFVSVRLFHRETILMRWQ